MEIRGSRGQESGGRTAGSAEGAERAAASPGSRGAPPATCTRSARSLQPNYRCRGAERRRLGPLHQARGPMWQRLPHSDHRPSRCPALAEAVGAPGLLRRPAVRRSGPSNRATAAMTRAQLVLALLGLCAIGAHGEALVEGVPPAAQAPTHSNRVGPHSCSLPLAPAQPSARPTWSSPRTPSCPSLTSST